MILYDVWLEARDKVAATHVVVEAESGVEALRALSDDGR